jgi:hypothetical protein
MLSPSIFALAAGLSLLTHREAHSNTGAVIMVVTRAMMTITVNKAGVISPRSRPTFRRISSMRPREFISAPMAIAFHFVSPLHRAAILHPAPLPTQAIATTASVRIQRLGLSTRPSFVFNPE